LDIYVQPLVDKSLEAQDCVSREPVGYVRSSGVESFAETQKSEGKIGFT
jgi:hypothetical protein